MNQVAACGEFRGSAYAAFIKTSAALKQKELDESTDFCPDEAKVFISKSLESCGPASTDLTW